MRSLFSCHLAEKGVESEKVLNVASETLENEAFPHVLLRSRKACKREKCLTLLVKPFKTEFLSFFLVHFLSPSRLINGKIV